MIYEMNCGVNITEYTRYATLLRTFNVLC